MKRLLLTSFVLFFLYFAAGSSLNAVNQGQIYFSEISCNNAGESQSTGFIEIKNITADEVSLSGVTLENAKTLYTVNLAGTVPAFGIVIITNGADLVSFESAWGVTLDINTTLFVQGDLLIGIGCGYDYSLNLPDVRLEIDATPVVNAWERVVQTQPNQWSAPSPPTTADPGVTSEYQILSVDFQSFYVSVDRYFDVHVFWVSISETDLMGFRLWRSVSSDFSTASILNSGNFILHEMDNNNQYEFVDTDVHSEQIYHYWIEVVQTGGIIEGYYFPKSITIPAGVTDFAEANLHISNYPNPFNPETTIEFDMSDKYTSPVDVDLSVYNIKGQKVITLIDDVMSLKEKHSVKWNGRDESGKSVSSGVYFYKLRTNDSIQTRKMVLMK